MITNFKNIITIIALCVAASFSGLVFSGRFDTLLQPNSFPDETPTHLLLKSDPEEIIYSQAYKTVDGKDEIRYGYLDEEAKLVEDEDIEKRTPSSQTVVLDIYENEEGEEMEYLRTTFLSSPQFYEVRKGEWKQIEYATTTQEVFSRSGAIRHIVQRELLEKISSFLFRTEKVFAQTSTFYSDADIESTSVDGQIRKTTFGSTGNEYQISQAATSGVTNDAGTPLEIRSSLYSPFSTAGTVARIFLLFDTSSLGSGATISSATLSVYVTSKINNDNDGLDTVNVITTTPASNTGLVADDYDNIGSTLQAAAADITSISTSAYLNFTLNATGEGNISKTGVTKFGLREGHDIASSDPVDDANGNQVFFSMAEETGTSQDPKLVVNYTVAADPVFHDVIWFD